MRLSIKAKQVAGVVLLVGLAVTILSGVYTALIARVLLEEAQLARRDAQAVHLRAGARA